MAIRCGLVYRTAIAAPKVSHKVNKILLNWTLGIPFLEKYERIYGARCLFESIIFTPLFEERIYSPKASSRNGVVGIIGRNIPINPKPTEREAIAMYMYFFIFFLYSQR